MPATIAAESVTGTRGGDTGPGDCP